MPVFALLAMTAISVSIGVVAVGLGTLAVASLVGAGIAALMHGHWPRFTRIKRVIAAGGLVLGVAGVVGGAIWLLDAGSPLTYPPNAAAQADARIEPLDVPDPDVLAAEIVDDLEAALEQFRAIAEDLGDVDD